MNAPLNANPVDSPPTQAMPAPGRRLSLLNPVKAGRADSRAGRNGPAPRLAAQTALLLADFLALSVALVAGSLLEILVTGGSAPLHALAMAVYAPLFVAVMGAYGLYRRGRRRLLGSSFPDLGQILHSVAVSSLVMLFVAGGLNRWLGLPRIDRTGVLFVGLLALAAVPLARRGARAVTLRGARTGPSHVLVVGSGMVADRVMERLAQSGEVQVVGWIDDNTYVDQLPSPRFDQQGRLPDLLRVVKENDVDHVVVAFTPTSESGLAMLLRALPSDVRISVVPRMFDLISVRSNIEDLRGLPVIDVAPPELGPVDRFAKRALDIIVSMLGLAILAPVGLAVAVAIKLTSRGPVLFSQPRTGRRGKTFRIHKFRTMEAGAESRRLSLSNEVDGPLFKVRSDPRMTRVGRFLRQTSLDEIPQLLNVLVGEMSLVGPRPFIVAESAEIRGWASKRFDVRPGMTGLWQVSGRNDLPFEELCRLDYAYVASWSLWWDLRILWHTPGVVFRRKGAY